MRIVWRLGIAGILALTLVLCVAAAFVSPMISALPTHLRVKPNAGKLLGQFTPAISALNFPATTGAFAAVVALVRVASTTPILQRIRVRIC